LRKIWIVQPKKKTKKYNKILEYFNDFIKNSWVEKKKTFSFFGILICKWVCFKIKLQIKLNLKNVYLNTLCDKNYFYFFGDGNKFFSEDFLKFFMEILFLTICFNFFCCGKIGSSFLLVQSKRGWKKRKFLMDFSNSKILISIFSTKKSLIKNTWKTRPNICNSLPKKNDLIKQIENLNSNQMTNSSFGLAEHKTHHSPEDKMRGKKYHN
jgi:hypothetical protein